MSFISLIRSSTIKQKEVLWRTYTKIAITDDGSTIVALHKSKEFPYELSKSFPEEVVKDNSVLKMNDINEVRRVFNEMSPEMARQQLSSLTLTTKHRWFPRARDKRVRKIEMNRPYL